MLVCLKVIKNYGSTFSSDSYHMRFKLHCNPHEMVRKDICSPIGRWASQKRLKYEYHGHAGQLMKGCDLPKGGEILFPLNLPEVQLKDSWFVRLQANWWVQGLYRASKKFQRNSSGLANFQKRRHGNRICLMRGSYNIFETRTALYAGI